MTAFGGKAYKYGEEEWFEKRRNPHCRYKRIGNHESLFSALFSPFFTEPAYWHWLEWLKSSYAPKNITKHENDIWEEKIMKNRNSLNEELDYFKKTGTSLISDEWIETGVYWSTPTCSKGIMRKKVSNPILTTSLKFENAQFFSHHSSIHVRVHISSFNCNGSFFPQDFLGKISVKLTFISFHE